MRAWPGFPPRDIAHWTPFVAAAFVIAAFVPFVPKFSVRVMVVIIASVAIAAFIAFPMKASFPSSDKLYLRIALAAAAIAALNLLFTSYLVKTPAGPAPAFTALLVAGIGASASIVISGSMLLGELSGLACAALGPFTVAAIIWPDKVSHSRAAELFIFVVAALFFTGTLLLDHLPLPCALLFAAALLSPLLLRIPALKRFALRDSLIPRIACALITAAVAALFAAASIALAIHASPPMDM